MADVERIDGGPRSVAVVSAGDIEPSLIRYLPALRNTLERHRNFRKEQLAQLSTYDRRNGPPEVHPDAARAPCEVEAVVAAGARQALADIEFALARMSDGSYGRCRACDANIPLAVLLAIPKTTLCLACHNPVITANSAAQ